MAAPRDRIMPARAISQPVFPRRPAMHLVRQLSLDSPYAPDYAPEYVTIETSEGEGGTVTRKVYVTEVSGICTLDLYSGWNPDTQQNRTQVRQLPAEVCGLVRLERLWASHNLLSSLPPNLSRLKNLRELLLHQNQFSEFPSVVCRLPNLQLLWLSSNQIARIPEDISRLTSLRRLHLDHNLLSELPDSLCHMTQLEVLYLNHNSLKNVCGDIGRLTALRRLFLQHNQITDLPHSMCELAAIERLDLSHNLIKHLTTDFRLYQTGKNDGGAKRVSTSDNPFESPLAKMKSTDLASPVGSPPRPRTMSFPLSSPGQMRRRSTEALRSSSPSHLPTRRSVSLAHSHSEEEKPLTRERRRETLPRGY